MNKENFKEPAEDDYLWRYIKPQYVDNFLNGDLYFSRLSQFNDSFEAINPTHYFMYQFLNRAVSKEFNLAKPIKELSSTQEVIGTLFMSLNIYDLEKELTRITGISDRSELSKLIYHYTENMNDFVEPQFELQNKHYASCWFVGDHIESALMWSAYSQPQGIAIRIKYKDFKKYVEDYFNQSNDFTLGIEEYYGGMINYCDYNDTDDWLCKLENLGNPVLFKQQFYKDEREYRLVLKRYDGFAREIFYQQHKIFDQDSKFTIILHPSSRPEDLQNLRSKIQGQLKYNIEMSEMSYYN